MGETSPPTTFTDLLDFFIQKSKLQVIEDFTELGLLAKKRECFNCTVAMILISSSDLSDGYAWGCYKCKATMSVRTGSLFRYCSLPFKPLTLMTYMWCHKYTQKQIKQELGLPENTIIDWFNLCQEISVKLNQKLNQHIGGPGVVVEVNEFKLKNKGFKKNPQQLFFGGIEINGNGCFFAIIKNKSPASYVDIILKHVYAGSVLYHPNSWKPAQILGTDGCETLALKHSITFFDSKPRKTKIERMWNNIMQNFTVLNEKYDRFDLHIRECLYRRYRANEDDIFLTFLKDIGTFLTFLK